MPSYTINIPDHGSFTVNSPEDLTDEQAYFAVTQNYPEVTSPRKSPTGGILESFIGGAKRLGSSTLTGLAAPFGAEEAAKKGIARPAAITELPGASLEEVKRAYAERGVLAAGKEAASQILPGIAEQLPFIGEMVAGAKLGAALTPPVLPIVGPLAKPIGGLAGAVAGPFIAQAGSNVERQAQEQAAQGKPVDINLGKAFGYAAPSAALDVVALRFGFGRILGIGEKRLGTDIAERLAKESLTKASLKGVGKTILAEVPTEIVQQMLERDQAGLDLTSPNAIKEYQNVAYQASLLSPLGGAARVMERGDAQQRDAATARKVAEEQAVPPIVELEVPTTAPTVPAVASEIPEPVLAVKAPLTVLPTQVAAETIMSFGFKKNSLAFKAMAQIDPTTEHGAKTFEAIIENNQAKIKTAEQEASVEQFRTLIADSQKSKEAQNVLMEPTTVEQPPDRAGVSTLDERQPEILAEGIGETIAGPVGPVGVDVGRPAGGTKPVGTPLADLQIGDTVNVGDSVYRKTDKGYDLVGPIAVEEQLQPEAPLAQEVIPTAEELQPEAPLAQEVLPTAEELQADDVTKQARSLRSELRVLEPDSPLIDELDAYDVNEATVAEARETVAQLMQERQARGLTQPRELRELRELREDVLATEGEPAVEAESEPVAYPSMRMGRLEYSAQIEAEAQRRKAEASAILEQQEIAGAEIVALRALLKDVKTLKGGLEALGWADAMGWIKVNNPQKQLITRLLTIDKAVNAKLSVGEHPNYGGEYNYKDHEIKIYSGGLKTLLHEAVHAATVQMLDKHVTHDVVSARKIPKGKTPYGKRLVNIYNKAISELQKKGLNPNVHYGLTDLHEFVAEAFTNPKFQEMLASTEGLYPTASTLNTLWDNFVESVRQLLNIPPKLHSLLNDIMAEAPTLFTGRQEGISTALTGKDVIHPSMAHETDLDALYIAAGGGTTGPTTPTAPFQDFRDDPKNYVKQKQRGLGRFLSELETMWFSSDAALQRALRNGIAAMGKSWDEVRQMLFSASTAQALHSEGVANQFLRMGAISYDETLYKFVVSKGAGSWAGIIREIKKAAQAHGVSYEQMQAYAHQALIARRLRGLKSKDRDVYIHLTEDQIQAGEELFKRIPELNDVVTQWNAVRENVLKFAVDSGLYDAKTAKELLDIMDYVPFYRVEQLEAGAGPRDYARGLLDAAKDKRFKGSEQEINNVFDNMERWASYVIRKGIGNKAAQNLTDAALQYLPDEVREVRNTSRGMGANTISIWRNGELQKYEFDDPLYIHAFTGIQSVALPALKGWSWFTNKLRQNIVLNPLFSIGQLSQDAFGAMFVSGVKHPFALPAQVVSEFIKTLRGTSTAHADLKALGVVGIRDYSAEVSRLDSEIAAGLKQPGLFDRLLNPLRALSMASDNAVRQAIYNQTLKETGDKALAVERALEVINFRRAGAGKSATLLRQTVPFFGAYLQAMNVAAKVIAGRGIAPSQKAEARRVLASTTLKVLTLGLIYNALVSDDEDYKKLDPSIRDRHLIIPGTGGLSIPLRADVFTLFAKIIPEHIYQRTMMEATEDSTKTTKALSDAFFNALLSPNVAPQAIKPLLEVTTNYNFFTGRPIVGQGVEQLDVEKQYSINTSELSKALGSAAGISPMKLDHLMKAYFGYTGATLLMATDDVLATGMGAPRPDKSYRDTIASIPGMSAFTSREFGNREMNDFYELRESVGAAVNTFNYLKTYGTPEERLAYREEHRDLLSVKSQVNRINENLAKLRKQERLLVEAKDTRYSAEEKQVKIHALHERRQNMLKNVQKLRAKAGL